MTKILAAGVVVWTWVGLNISGVLFGYFRCDLAVKEKISLVLAIWKTCCTPYRSTRLYSIFWVRNKSFLNLLFSSDWHLRAKSLSPKVRPVRPSTKAFYCILDSFLVVCVLLEVWMVYPRYGLTNELYRGTSISFFGNEDISWLTDFTVVPKLLIYQQFCIDSPHPVLIGLDENHEGLLLTGDSFYMYFTEDPNYGTSFLLNILKSSGKE